MRELTVTVRYEKHDLASFDVGENVKLYALRNVDDKAEICLALKRAYRLAKSEFNGGVSE